MTAGGLGFYDPSQRRFHPFDSLRDSSLGVLINRWETRTCLVCGGSARVSAIPEVRVEQEEKVDSRIVERGERTVDLLIEVGPEKHPCPSAVREPGAGPWSGPRIWPLRR